ncbi:hypothetical protein P8935_23215 [Telmatobacter sp. DSM 110680]|uniref:DUF2141 domain-containing protein n=1 Tax=Telmatobacter sp. DSM 110680 TaxID=3036704 RepID=A0AAU7DK37_9BACT
MARRTIGSVLLLCSVLLGTSYCAEPTKTIIIKVFDGKSGHPVMPTGFQVRVDHLTMLHPDWVKQNDDGTAELTIPADTEVVALHLAYQNSMELYVNCDAEKNTFGDVWYRVPEIASKGFVAANGCAKAKVNEKFKTTAAPGELILFVREKNLKERTMD